MFNESIKNSFTLSFDSWYTDCKVVNDRLEFQTDIGSAQNVNSPNFLIAAHQIARKIGVPNKNNNVAIFDNLDVRKKFLKLMVNDILKILLIITMLKTEILNSSLENLLEKDF